MQFESQWPGDAIAAPFCPTDDREDRFFDDPGHKSWNRVDSRADAAPTAAVRYNLAPGILPAGQRAGEEGRRNGDRGVWPPGMP